jgi:hypothetical protein
LGSREPPKDHADGTGNGANVSGWDPTEWLLWSVFIDNSDRRTFTELVRDSSQVKLVGREQLEGEEVWQIRAQAPASWGNKFPNTYFDIFIEPSKSFCVRRLVKHQTSEEVVAGKKESYPMEVDRTVLRFKDFGDGVFVPEEVETKLTVKRAEPFCAITHTDVKVLALNQPLAEDALSFHFPKDVQVIDSRTSTVTTNTVFLWGADDKPVKEIKSLEDLPGYQLPPVTPPPSPDHKSSKVWWILLLVNAVLLMALLLFLRVRRGGHSRAS